MILLGVEVTDRSPIRGLGIRMPRLQKEAMRQVGVTWHREMLPSHFTPGNKGRYGMEKRTDSYKKRKMRVGIAQGRYVDLILKGKSLRHLKAFHTITATSKQATVRMRPPTYFTKPFIGSYTKDGKPKRVTRQPDKPAETTRTTDRERQRLRDVNGTVMNQQIALQAHFARTKWRTGA